MRDKDGVITEVGDVDILLGYQESQPTNGHLDGNLKVWILGFANIPF